METLKVVLAMLALVLIGFIGGFATHRHLAQERINNIARMHRPPGVMEELRRAIRPNQEQIKEIRPFFKDWAKDMQGLRRGYNQERVARMDTLILDLKPILEAEQVERLERRFDHFKKRTLKEPKARKSRSSNK